MPYEIRKVQKGWKVFTKGTDRSHSNDPLSLARAKAQLKALYANTDETDLKGGMIGGFDDNDFYRLFASNGVGGVKIEGEDDDAIDQGSKEDAEAIVKQAEDKFDVEEATGEPEYLKQAKAFAKKAGYKDASSLKLADDGKHKLVLRGVKFGSITNNDFIIYKQHFPAIAEKKRKQYLARARKIKGDWAKDRYSPNSLAINILWDGSRKDGGFDGGELISGAVKEGANLVGDTVSDFFKTPEQKEEERKRKEACKICAGEGGKRGGEKQEDADLKRRREIQEAFYRHHPNQRPLPPPPAWLPPPNDPFWLGNAPPLDGNGYSGGAVPLNKKLYEQAKAEVYPRYKKPSAYRSGAVVKRYKELGGKFKDNNGRPLARWFKEEWKDVGNQDYPVYRPTKRVSKDTPLTASEIDPENLRLQVREKQEIRGEKNLKPFVAKQGGRLAQTDEEEAREVRIAKKIIQKVAGEQNAEVKKVSETPMGDNNIRKYLPNAKILKYSELADVENIEELLPSPKSYFFLLYEHAFNNGHWVVINRYINNGKDTICFFCSYGSKIDAPLRWNSPARNQELGQGTPYLSILLRKSGKTLQYNNVAYQSKTSPVATCGAFATLWIKANLRENMSLTDFHDWIKEIKDETGLSYDAIASNAISSRTAF
jgi:hypothetical protein